METTSIDTVAAPRNWKSLLLEHKDALLCLVDQGVVSAAGFGTSVLIGRHAPSELGVYFIALSIVLFIRGFQEQMISVPYTIYHHQYKDTLASYRGSCLIQQSGLVSVCLVFLVGMLIAASTGWLKSDLVSPLIVLLFLMPALMMREVIRQYCFTHHENLSVLAIDSGITVLQICALVVLGYFNLLSGASAWAVIGLACAITLGVWYFQNRPGIKFATERWRADWNQNWSFGKWAVGGQLVGSLPTYILPFILAESAGTADTGLFAAAMTLVGIANIFKMGIANFLTPKAAQVYVDHGAPGLKRVLLQMALIFLVFIGGFALVLALAGGWIAVVVYDSRYTGLQAAMGLLALAQLCEGLAIVASNGLYVLGRIKANFWVDVILMIVVITAAVLLVNPLGVMGAVWTSLIGTVVSATLRFALLLVFLHRDTAVGEANAA